MSDTTIAALVARAHGTARAKGFHDKPVHLSTAIALIRTELAEAVEADRQPDVVDITLSRNEFDYLTGALKAPGLRVAADILTHAARPRDRGEELGDAAIRIFDTAGAEGLDMDPWLDHHCPVSGEPATLRKRQAAAVKYLAGVYRRHWAERGFAGWLEHVHLELAQALENAKYPDSRAANLAWALNLILAAAEWLGIDLEAKVLAKMERNEQRPHKHGKAY